MSFSWYSDHVSADNPASTSLGGFKETAAAFRFCRHSTGTDVQSMVLNDDNMYIKQA